MASLTCFQIVTTENQPILSNIKPMPGMGAIGGTLTFGAPGISRNDSTPAEAEVDASNKTWLGCPVGSVQTENRPFSKIPVKSTRYHPILGGVAVNR